MIDIDIDICLLKIETIVYTRSYARKLGGKTVTCTN